MSCKNSNKKKKALRIIGAVLLIIVVIVCILGYTFRSHIRAALIFLTTSNEDIQKNIETAKDQQTEILNNSGFYANKEADDALVAGLITPEEHTQILLGNLTLDELKESKKENEESAAPEVAPEVTDEQDMQNDDGKEAEPNKDAASPGSEKSEAPDEVEAPAVPESDKTVVEKKDEDTKPPETAPAEKVPVQAPTQQSPPVQQTGEVDKRIAELVTKMYVLKADYTASIDAIIASMKAEYVKLPPEQKTRSAKQNIATGYLGQINAMEVQCDAQVNAIVSELRQILKDNGRDMSLADSIMATYATEKENTKAYYISTYGD